MEKAEENMLKCISIIYRKTQMYLNDQMKELGLTSGQATFLIITCEKGKMVQNRFCNLLDMDKSTVAKMLMKLEDEGYVVRRKSGEDGRAIDVYPTARAQEVYPRLKRIGREWTDRIMSGMTGEERSRFFAGLDQIADNAAGYR